ncbi:MAG: hypothetical protein ACE5JG_08340, partial [Planctomycetota bacterium]
FYRRLALAAGLLLAVSVGLLTWNRAAWQEPAPVAGKRVRTLDPLLEAGRRRTIDGAELARLLRSLGVSPDEAVIGPETSGVVTVGFDAVEER